MIGRGSRRSAIRALFPNAVTTTERMGRAMIAVARRGYPKPILEAADINAAAAGQTPAR